MRRTCAGRRSVRRRSRVRKRGVLRLCKRQLRLTRLPRARQSRRQLRQRRCAGLHRRRLLLAARRDIFDQYSIEGFRAAFGESFRIVREAPIDDSPRTLFLLERR